MRPSTVRRLERIEAAATPAHSGAAFHVAFSYAADPGFIYVEGERYAEADYAERYPATQSGTSVSGFRIHIVNGPAPNGDVSPLGGTSPTAVAPVESGKATGITPLPEGYPYHTTR